MYRIFFFKQKTAYEMRISDWSSACALPISKFAGSVFGRPLRMNLAVYNQWIKDVQRAQFPDPPGPAASIAYTVNVPEARVTGAEFALTFKPAHWLETGLTDRKSVV